MIAIVMRLSSEPPSEIEIHLDRAGLDTLIAQLELLRSRKTEHLDLLSEDWGGNVLSRRDVEGMSPIHYLKVILECKDPR